MSGTLTVAIQSAKSGLLTTQAAVGAAASNIANANTEGYSRKIANFENRVLNGSGSGVQLSDFTRAIDEGLVSDLRDQLSATNELGSQEAYFQRIQNLFGAPGDNDSISHIINELQQATEALAANPSETLEQNDFVRYANDLALTLQNMTSAIQDLRLQADTQISTNVAEINSLTQIIATTNDQIIRNEAVSNDVTSLLDQRDNALTRLSELINISSFPRGNGDLVVMTSDGFALVDRTQNELTHVPAGNVGATSNYSEGDFTGIYVGQLSGQSDITEVIQGGQLAGFIAQRDDVLPALQSQLDELSSTMRDVMNQIHNRGTAVPGLQEMSGTREFIDADNQTIQLDPTNSTADVTIALMNASGQQQSVTTLNTIMVSGSYGTGLSTDHGAWTISEIAATTEDWLQDNGASGATVAVGTDGRLDINLNNSSLYIAIRDQTASANGSSAADIDIGFDADGDGAVDETVQGFSNFFGLNDLFTDASDGSLHESNQVSSSFSASAATFTFYDEANGIGPGNSVATVSIDQRDSLNTVMTKINDANFGVTASIIPDGSGSRLRIQADDGNELLITQATGNTLLNDLGIKPTSSRSASSIAVREDIIATPSNVSTALLQYDTNSAEYTISNGDNTVVQQMADAMSGKVAFNATGGLSTTSKSFEEYGTDILSRAATLAATNESEFESHEMLTESLQLESDRISGVNLDEEMSNLVLFQQAYSASARVISIIQEMFKTLEAAF